MLLTIDAGNTNITLGVYEKDELKFVARMATDRSKTGDQYAIDLKDILGLYSVSVNDLDGAIICSVVPVLANAFKSAIKVLTGFTPLMVGPGIKSGLNIKIDNPAQLGADLVASAVVAVQNYPLPCIVFDLGTATTVSVVDKTGGFIGGMICAGIGISLDALTTRTSQLPQISIEAPNKVIGSNTVDCMKSGLVFGQAAMLDGLAERIEEELGEEATILATGGLSREIVPHCKKKMIISENLLLDGLKIIYDKNIG